MSPIRPIAWVGLSPQIGCFRVCAYGLSTCFDLRRGPRMIGQVHCVPIIRSGFNY